MHQNVNAICPCMPPHCGKVRRARLPELGGRHQRHDYPGLPWLPVWNRRPGPNGVDDPQGLPGLHRTTPYSDLNSKADPVHGRSFIQLRYTNWEAHPDSAVCTVGFRYPINKLQKWAAKLYAILPDDCRNIPCPLAIAMAWLLGPIRRFCQQLDNRRGTARCNIPFASRQRHRKRRAYRPNPVGLQADEELAITEGRRYLPSL